MRRSLKPLVALMLVMGLVVAACGDDDSSEPEPPVTTTAAPAPTTTEAQDEPEEPQDAAVEEPTETTAAPDPEEDMETETTEAATTTTAAEMEEMPMGGALRMVIGAEPSTLNPMTGTRADQVVAISIIERLVATDANAVPSTHGLVNGWERVDDLTWRFTMREGVHFTNGELAGADAAAFSSDHPSRHRRFGAQGLFRGLRRCSGGGRHHLRSDHHHPDQRRARTAGKPLRLPTRLLRGGGTRGLRAGAHRNRSIRRCRSGTPGPRSSPLATPTTGGARHPWTRSSGHGPVTMPLGWHCCKPVRPIWW